VTAPGQIPGQPAWDDYVDALVREHGSLAAVAARLAEARAWREDVESIARALRRLRGRGARPGGVWGTRLVATFGLPQPVEARLRFMGSYHSRFVDLPVSLCTDLVQLWDRPPTSESRIGRLWLSLARATLALRAGDLARAKADLRTARAVSGEDIAGGIELALAEARMAGDEQSAPATLARIRAIGAEIARLPAGHEADCLRARWIGQESYALNRQGDLARSEALLRALPDEATTAPFARSRRANGVAYACYRRGALPEALDEARRAVRFAGDAGHVRLRAMALLMVARIAARDHATREGEMEADDARTRARAIAIALEDATLLARCDASARAAAQRG
jgi:hypothetical protein